MVEYNRYFQEFFVVQLNNTPEERCRQFGYGETLKMQAKKLMLEEIARTIAYGDMIKPKCQDCFEMEAELQKEILVQKTKQLFIYNNTKWFIVIIISVIIL